MKPPRELSSAGSIFPPWAGPAAATALVAIAIVTHLINLGVRPVMHDESLFAYYSFVAMQQFERTGMLRDAYTHMPILHGPTLMLATAWLFHHFGDSIALARGWVSLLSLGVFAGAMGLWPKRLRWTLAPLIVASPSMLFYGRFFRNDVLFCAVATVGMFCIARGLSRRRGHVVLSIAGMALLLSLITLMENAIFIYAAAITFGAVYWALRMWSRWSPESYRWLKSLRILRNAGQFELAERTRKPAVRGRKQTAAKAKHEEQTSDYSVLNWPGWPSRLGWIAGVALGIVIVAWIYGHLAGQAALDQSIPATKRINEFFSQHRIIAKISYGLGLVNMLASWQYWAAQHAVQRIGGPLHYHLPILAIYELPLLLLTYVGLIWDASRRWSRGLLYAGSMAGWLAIWEIWTWIGPPDTTEKAGLISKGLNFLHLEPSGSVLTLGILIVPLLVWSILQILEHRPLASWLGWWAACSIFQYSSAGEKVPWLAVHIALPMYLAAGWIWGPLLARQGRAARAARNTLIVFAVAGSLIAARADLRFLGNDEANPHERMPYNHTTVAVDRLIKNRLALWEEKKEQVPLSQRRVLFVDDPNIGGPSWPGVWYFRHCATVLPPVASAMLDQKWDLVLGTDQAILPMIKDKTAGRWDVESLSLRDHWMAPWPEEERWRRWSEGAKGAKEAAQGAARDAPDSFTTLLGASIADLWKYYWYRETWTEPGSYPITALDPARADEARK